MKYLKILCLLSSLAWLGCSENETIETTESARMKNLTNGEWVRVKYELNGKDVMPIFPECSKDDYTGYQNDGTAFLDQGENMCDTTFSARITWNWKFIENETKMEETLNDTTVYIREIRVLDNDYFEYVSYSNPNDSLVSGFEKL